MEYVTRTIKSLKHGSQEVILDLEDAEIFDSIVWHLYTTPRHHTYYLQCNKTKDHPSYRFHRLIMNVTDSKLVVDHINHNGLDNRKSNLRVTTQKGNNANASKRKNAQTSKYKGVHLDRTHGKWKAQIQYENVKYTLGTYLIEDEAASAYNQAAVKYFGEFAVLNEITNNQEDNNPSKEDIWPSKKSNLK